MNYRKHKLPYLLTTFISSSFLQQGVGSSIENKGKQHVAVSGMLFVLSSYNKYITKNDNVLLFYDKTCGKFNEQYNK